MDKTIILKPRLSEKAYGLSNQRNTYVLDVPGDANKHTVIRAVKAQFDVTVVKVNLTNVKGKAKRTVRKGGRAVSGRESDTRKAYITLEKGQSLPFFAAIEEEEAKQAKTAETFAKAAEKAEKKEEKAAKPKGGLLGSRKKKEEDK